MKKAALSDPNLIFSTTQLDNKIYIREQKGYFQRLRRGLSSGLIFLFILLPLLTYQGKQAFLIDIEAQKINFFSMSLFPQDLVIICLIFILAAFLLFYITRLYGRVWCGYTCPQTVWMLMFNWFERRIEGTHRHSEALDKARWSAHKVIKKGTKHLVWLILSLFTSLVFISYFVPAKTLYLQIFTFEASLVVQGWVYFFAVCTYINGGWIKEKMCLHICPYARFQSSMFSSDTKLVTYNAARGEARGPRKRNMEKPADKGDCVDCKLCVEVCPVGIDIRNGLQYECINCGLCIDACDSVMKKFNYPTQLIQYKSEQPTTHNLKRHFTYGIAILITLFGIFAWGYSRNEVELNILRDRQALYRVSSYGKVENSYSVKTLNKTQATQHFYLQLQSSEKLELEGETQFSVAPGKLHTSVISIAANQPLEQDEIKIKLVLLNEQNKLMSTAQTLFYSSKEAW